MAVAVTFVASVGHAAPRLQWDAGGGTVSWHRACTFAHSDPALESSAAHRFVTLRASLRSLARSDAALYAVFLDDALDLDDLKELLESAGAPPGWSNAAGGPVRCEWVAMAMNGAITLRIDEAHHPGNLVAVVNGAGEILGSHRLWAANDDLAALHLD
jgi:hypothetical protein